MHPLRSLKAVLAAGIHTKGRTDEGGEGSCNLAVVPVECLDGHAGCVPPGSGKKQDVVRVHHYKDVEHVFENVVHRGLEDSRGIGEAERHDKVLIVASQGLEGGLPLVLPSPPCTPEV